MESFVRAGYDQTGKLLARWTPLRLVAAASAETISRCHQTARARQQLDAQQSAGADERWWRQSANGAAISVQAGQVLAAEQRAASGRSASRMGIRWAKFDMSGDYRG